MRYLLFLLLYLLAACGRQSASKKQPVAADTLPNGLRIVNTIDSPFYYKDQVTTDSLKGGYRLVYAEDDSFRYVFLQKGEKLSLLDKTEGGSFYNLGWVDADEEGYIVLAHDQGNSTPFAYEFIDKVSMKNILGYGITIHDWDTLGGQTYFLYNDTLPGSQRMILQNLSTQKREYFSPPEKAYEILIDTLTASEMRISYTINMAGDPLRSKTYRRN